MSERRASDRPAPVREATPGELPAVMGVLDGAMLDVDAASVAERVPEDVLVATAGAEAPDDDRILGALVLDGDEIDAVAVRPGRRGQGIGTALVEAAADRRDRLVAEFDAGVRPFYERLAFDIEPASQRGRYRGVWTPE